MGYNYIYLYFLHFSSEKCNNLYSSYPCCNRLQSESVKVTLSHVVAYPEGVQTGQHPVTVVFLNLNEERNQQFELKFVLVLFLFRKTTAVEGLTGNYPKLQTAFGLGLYALGRLQ